MGVTAISLSGKYVSPRQTTLSSRNGSRFAAKPGRVNVLPEWGLSQRDAAASIDL
jgi:hypothetical protein